MGKCINYFKSENEYNEFLADGGCPRRNVSLVENVDADGVSPASGADVDTAIFVDSVGDVYRYVGYTEFIYEPV